MSEYQYYEFRKMDSALTSKERKDVASLSSRANVTSHQATFVYHYGDFSGNEEELMATHFDMMLYVANWGARRLMFRLPSSLIDMSQIAPFCISSEIGHWLSQDKQHIILDLDFSNEDEYGDWMEGDGLLDELTDLREELIGGDFRLLYLAWLKVAPKALAEEDIDEDSMEPPIPSGLKNLSNAQKAYMKFWNIDEGMVAVASKESKEQSNRAIDIESYIDKLSEDKRDEFLIRLSRGEENLSAVFNRYLYELATKGKSENREETTDRRTISSIIELSEEWHREKTKKRKEQQEFAHKNKMELLAKKRSSIWDKVYDLIDEKQTNAYDKAIEHLKELQELSAYQGEESLFKQQIAEIQSTYPRLQGLLRRMRSAGVIR
ncbi:hypothetical protein GSY74_01010 [Sulfurovum sp. bin170]|uniref:hypothetical protein n=1 Tax=Sulfurovum sp. bin170 TaxID=2695268 RepID=UPI0013E09848|nr:hypothetical protein [Sulfurovum sp. bin170]NEW59847.1 hypothetical protein [Sulfurovum sp. bin170]